MSSGETVASSSGESDDPASGVARFCSSPIRELSPEPVRASAASVRRMGWRPGSQPRWQGENLERNQGVVEKVREIADAKGWTPGQFALAWVLARGEDIVPIPGTKRRAYLEENLAAVDVQLGPEDIGWIDAHGRRPQATATMAS